MPGKSKTAIATGASQGIGAGVVAALLEKGYQVVANSRNIPKKGPFAESELRVLQTIQPPHERRRALRRWLVPVTAVLAAIAVTAGAMTLGEVMQAVSAFMIVQAALSWLVENYPRLADWTASASRVASLLVSLDRLERAESEGTAGRIVRKQSEDGALRPRQHFDHGPV